MWQTDAFASRKASIFDQQWSSKLIAKGKPVGVADSPIPPLDLKGADNRDKSFLDFDANWAHLEVDLSHQAFYRVFDRFDETFQAELPLKRVWTLVPERDEE